jgi:hypothetical protein
VYQNIPGTAHNTTLVVPNSVIAPELGRNLGQCRGAATCNGTLTVRLEPIEAVREKRASQLDLRFSKSFNLAGAGRLRAGFDIYNALNSDDVLALTSAYGGSWLRPGGVLAGRLYKFNAQLDF